MSIERSDLERVQRICLHEAGHFVVARKLNYRTCGDESGKLVLENFDLIRSLGVSLALQITEYSHRYCLTEAEIANAFPSLNNSIGSR